MTDPSVGARSCSLHLDNKAIVSRVESTKIWLGFTTQLSN